MRQALTTAATVWYFARNCEEVSRRGAGSAGELGDLHASLIAIISLHAVSLRDMEFLFNADKIIELVKCHKLALRAERCVIAADFFVDRLQPAGSGEEARER